MIEKLSVIIICFLLLAGSATLYSWLRYRRRLRFLQGHDMGWPVRAVSLEAFDDAFARNSFGPTIELAEVAFLGEGDGIVASTSDIEAWVLAVLSKSARSMFEFGTCTGRTAYLWARNSPVDAKIVTLTLAPDQVQNYHAGASDSAKATKAALRESCHVKFIYSGTSVEHKITQIFCDSKNFDESPYLGQFDLIFVDGSHAYSYVKSDTEKALRMLKPGGIILWHDYNPLNGRSIEGAYRFLNELNHQLPLLRLRKTCLVVYRSPKQPA